jgi:hypothetical protein
MSDSRDNPFRRKRPPLAEKSANSKQIRGDGRPDARGVVRGAGSRPGLRRLPQDIADLAEGRVERLRRPPRERPAMEDHRLGFVLPGVRNRDARAVFDARVDALRAASARADRAGLGAGLSDARRMMLWRARAVTDFAAFAESVVGLAPDEAERLSREGGPVDVLPEQVIALWMRLESALTRTCPQGRVRVTGKGDQLAFELHVPGNEVSRAVEGFFDMGGAAVGLRPFLGERGSAHELPAPRRDDAERGPRRDARPPRSDASERGRRTEARPPRRDRDRDRRR